MRFFFFKHPIKQLLQNYKYIKGDFELNGFFVFVSQNSWMRMNLTWGNIFEIIMHCRT